jgi:8-oxo-dGTP pyrophosphatase MutT (NUDIX family)
VTSFRVVSETTRVRAGFLALAEVEVVGPTGERFTRTVVRHPGAVMVVPVDADREHVFMIRQYRASVDRELLEVPAGKRDVEGEPPEVTASRELTEEIGRQPRTLVKLCECFMSPGFTDEYAHIFCGLDLTDETTTQAASPEEAAMTIERIALADVDMLIATRQLVDVKSTLGLVLTRRYLSGEYAGMQV